MPQNGKTRLEYRGPKDLGREEELEAVVGVGLGESGRVEGIGAARQSPA